MFCRHCGNEVSESDEFCTKCGKSLKNLGLYDIDKIEKTEPPKNGMAVAGFVCSFFVPLLGFIFGGIGLKRAKEKNGKGKGFSIAAIIIATIMFFINLSILM